MAHLAFAFCFAALYAFHLFVLLQFLGRGGPGLKDYDQLFKPLLASVVLA